jgi:hypothetical protein
LVIPAAGLGLGVRGGVVGVVVHTTVESTRQTMVRC